MAGRQCHHRPAAAVEPRRCRRSGEDIAQGLIRLVSIGYAVEDKSESITNGVRTVVATKWRPREVSFVPISGGPQRAHTTAVFRQPPHIRARRTGPTVILLALSAYSGGGIPAETVDDWIDRGFTVEQARGEILDAMIRRGAQESPMTAHNRFTFDNPANQTGAIGEAIYHRMTGTARPIARAAIHARLGYRSDADSTPASQRCAAAQRRPGGVYQAAMVTRASPGLHTTADFPTLLGDSMGRRLGELFVAAQSGATLIAASGTVRDFSAGVGDQTLVVPGIAADRRSWRNQIR